MLLTRPTRLLRVEALVLLIGSLALYQHRGDSWLLFAILLFIPDLSMLGYLGGSRLGAASYNLAHTTSLPIVLAASGHVLGRESLITMGVIWFAHVVMDRVLGYGLKLPTHFTHTHLRTDAVQPDTPGLSPDRLRGRSIA